MKKEWTLEEKMQRITDIEDIKTLIHKRVYLQTSDSRQQELETMWVSTPQLKQTASYGSNWGYYVGMEEIRKYYVDAHDAALKAQQEENGASRINLGNMYIHPLSTGLVETAQDGKTAKGLWYSIGNEAKALSDGTAQVQWMLSKVAVDFVREEDGWKIWHIVISTDVDCEAGKNYGDYPVYVDWTADSDNPVRREFGTPTIEKLTHDVTFNWWDDYPFIPPKNYETFTDEISYGPEGYKAPAVIGLKAGEGRNWK